MIITRDNEKQEITIETFGVFGKEQVIKCLSEDTYSKYSTFFQFCEEFPESESAKDCETWIDNTTLSTGIFNAKEWIAENDKEKWNDFLKSFTRFPDEEETRPDFLQHC